MLDQPVYKSLYWIAAQLDRLRKPTRLPVSRALPHNGLSRLVTGLHPDTGATTGDSEAAAMKRLIAHQGMPDYMHRALFASIFTDCCLQPDAGRHDGNLLRSLGLDWSISLHSIGRLPRRIKNLLMRFRGFTIEWIVQFPYSGARRTHGFHSKREPHWLRRFQIRPVFRSRPRVILFKTIGQRP